VIAALLAVMLVPVPTFRSVPLGIVLAVLSVLAATLTLLPAALSTLGHRINRGRIRLPSAADHHSERFAAWGRRLWARSCSCSPHPRSDCGRGCRRSP
jgi:RND superfamily putative drug exporter